METSHAPGRVLMKKPGFCLGVLPQGHLQYPLPSVRLVKLTTKILPCLKSHFSYYCLCIMAQPSFHQTLVLPKTGVLSPEEVEG